MQAQALQDHKIAAVQVAVAPVGDRVAQALAHGPLIRDDACVFRCHRRSPFFVIIIKKHDISIR
jgi:hypothetical protein